MTTRDAHRVPIIEYGVSEEARVMQSLHQWLCGLAGPVLACICAASIAQSGYPTRPIRAVVSWAPGGGADLTARVVGQKLSEQLGQQFVVDNRAGASGAIGTQLVAKAVPNGYTVLVGGVTELVLNPQIVKVPYDPVGDFTGVSPLAFGYYALVINPNLTARTVKDLIALARSRPGELKYASGGTGTNLSLVAELFKVTAGVDIAHIPYKGGGPAGLAVIGGEAQLMFASAATMAPHVNSNRLVALAVTSPRRSPVMPDVPTFGEIGMRGLEVGLWFALMVPKGTPRDIVARLNMEVVKLAATSDYKAQLDKLGFEPYASTPEQLTAFLKAEFDRWGKVIKTAGVKGD